MGVGGQGGASDGESEPEPSSPNADMSGAGRPAGAKSPVDKPPPETSALPACSKSKYPPLKLGEAGDTAPQPGLELSAAKKREWSAECRPSPLLAVAVDALAPLAWKRDRDRESDFTGREGPPGFVPPCGVPIHCLTAGAEFASCMIDTFPAETQAGASQRPHKHIARKGIHDWLRKNV